MNREKISEFLTVLAFAVIVGGAAALSNLYLEGLYQTTALVAIVIAALILWQVLRKKFRKS